MSTYQTKVQNYKNHKTHSSDGLQSVPQWESAFNYPSGGKVRVLLHTVFVNINKGFSWESSMPSRLEYSKHKERSFMIQSTQTQNIGALAAYPFSPYLSDGLGRRPAIIIGAFIMIVATVVPNSFPLCCWDVHWSSVSPRSTPAKTFSNDLFAYYSFLIGFRPTFAASAAPHRSLKSLFLLNAYRLHPCIIPFGKSLNLRRAL
jgi:MFS family permease